MPQIYAKQLQLRLCNDDCAFCAAGAEGGAVSSSSPNDLSSDNEHVEIVSLPDDDSTEAPIDALSTAVDSQTDADVFDIAPPQSAAGHNDPLCVGEGKLLCHCCKWCYTF